MGGLQVCPNLKLTKTERERRKVKFPDCIGFFPDKECIESTPEKPGPDCYRCPHYMKERK